MYKLTPKEVCKVVSGDEFFVKRILMLRFECLLLYDLYHLVVHSCVNKLVESVLV